MVLGAVELTTTLIPEASAALVVRMSAPALMVVGPLKVLGAASVRSPSPAFVSALLPLMPLLTVSALLAETVNVRSAPPRLTFSFWPTVTEPKLTLVALPLTLTLPPRVTVRSPPVAVKLNTGDTPPRLKLSPVVKVVSLPNVTIWAAAGV